MTDYKHPEVLVSTQWAAEHLNDPKVRLVEVDVDTTAYDQGHIAGAVGWNWQTQLQDNIRRDLIDKAALEKLLGKSGISNDTTILLYGDNNNWFAAYAFWQLKYYGHKDVRLINGGRKKWLEEKRPLTTDAPKVPPPPITPPGRTNPCARARKMFCRSSKSARRPSGGRAFRGRVHREDHRASGHDRNRAARRAYSRAPRTFPGRRPQTRTARSRAPMRWRSYRQAKGVNGSEEVIAYCRIGERSSHTWFVLKYLLGSTT